MKPFNNSVPGIAFRGEKGKENDKSSDKSLVWAGRYYLACEAKLGQVFSWSTKRVFKDYRVKPQWVTAWLSVIAMISFPYL